VDWTPFLLTIIGNIQHAITAHGDVDEETADMSTLNISLPPAMKAFIDTQVHSGRYSSASDYVRTLIRADQDRWAEALVATALLDGCARPAGAEVPQAVQAWLRTQLHSLGHAGHGGSG
jgi:antitoxin ParD1/3/4